MFSVMLHRRQPIVLVKEYVLLKTSTHHIKKNRFYSLISRERILPKQNTFSLGQHSMEYNSNRALREYLDPGKPLRKNTRSVTVSMRSVQMQSSSYILTAPTSSSVILSKAADPTRFIMTLPVTPPIGRNTLPSA